jgi:lipoate-protein ligase A
VVTLRELMGADLPELPEIKQALLDGLRERLGIDPVRGEITADEEALAARIYDQEIGTDAFVHEIDEPLTGADTFHASHTGPGGTVTAYLRLEGPAQNRIREVLLTGDFFVTPPRMVFDLEASLRGVPVDGIADAVASFFHPGRAQMLSLTADDFRTVIEAAASQRD